MRWCFNSVVGLLLLLFYLAQDWLVDFGRFVCVFVFRGMTLFGDGDFDLLSGIGCVMVCFVAVASSLAFAGGLLLYGLISVVTGVITLCLVCWLTRVSVGLVFGVGVALLWVAYCVLLIVLFMVSGILDDLVFGYDLMVSVICYGLIC